MPTEEFRYDPKTILLHWGTVLAVVLLWSLGQSIDLFPRGAPRISARSCHITLGIALALLLCYRLWWRRSGGRRLPESLMSKQQRAATLLHVLLYVLLLATVAAGLANVWVGGHSYFQLFTVPKFDPGNKELVEQVEDVHALLANGVAIAATLHAAIALFHHHVLHDAVLRRMLRR